MRKYQKLIMAITFALTITQLIDAAPRGRRRARRNNQNYTVTRNYPQATPYQSSPAPQYAIAPATNLIQPQLATNNVVPIQAPVPAAVEARPLDVGDSLPVDPVAHVAFKIPTPDTAPSFPVVQQPAVHYPAVNPPQAGSAIAEVNAIRARSGLPPFIEDASLSAVAYQKASIQANRGAMGHPGGSMGGARYEGVGMGPQFIACYLRSNVGQYAGAATVRGANGQRYHCLLIR